MKYIKSEIDKDVNTITIEVSFEELTLIKPLIEAKARQLKTPRLITQHEMVADEIENIMRIMRVKFDDYAKTEDYENAIIP